ncbi:uncharacterized protein LOC132736157 [Ruditapes philippinarum]|uniref:uncharacterized protein LOC132736157 n=1 Tax=Ruditapes philippinarum TaxID=129788 RepID=UPI00295AE323|nr:uncharacterized protein LOC132736157 [Ruditapes philippinarum]
MAMYSEDKKSRGGSTTGCFDCCTLLMVVWFSITILAIILGFGLSGIYGVIACSNQELKLNACSSAAESKMAISIVTIILTLILFILSLAIFHVLFVTLQSSACLYWQVLILTDITTTLSNDSVTTADNREHYLRIERITSALWQIGQMLMKITERYTSRLLQMLVISDSNSRKLL